MFIEHSCNDDMQNWKKKTVKKQLCINLNKWTVFCDLGIHHYVSI